MLQTETPPNGYNCRCVLLEIFNEDTKLTSTNHAPPTAEVDGATVVPGPDAGFGFNPVNVMEAVPA
jgi:uncharacterized protein with gpF-like domain